MDLMMVMQYVMGLSRVQRAGWNLDFPPDGPFRTRVVEYPECVSAHVHDLWWLAMLVVPLINRTRTTPVDLLRLLGIISVHDLMEVLVGDGNAHVIEDLEARRRFKEEKRARETSAMQEICAAFGQREEEFFGLWLEYRDRSTIEGQLAAELDKLAAAWRAVEYFLEGQQVYPEEFLAHARQDLTQPVLIELWEQLGARMVGARASTLSETT